jgi:UDP-N-acetylmuramoyl-tripeptide--D-alanyl-D-alanine ligase
MWASDFLAHACGASVTGPTQKFTSVSTDTRTLQPGALYVALHGENFDGHRFVEQAIKAGASGVLASQPIETTGNITVMQVADTLIALQQMAHASRLAFDGPVIAVTGSNGKTTTKEMIAAVLRAHYGADAVLATTGNLNNHIGVPLTLLARKSSHKVAVIEMGMNHFGEIALLTRLTEPTVALITNAGPAHLEGVGSIEGVAEAKGEIFSGLRSGGVAVINADDFYAPYWQVVARQWARRSFGFHPHATVTSCYTPPSSLEIQLPERGGSVQVTLNQVGEHNAANAMAAAAVCNALGVPLNAIKRGLESASNVGGRLSVQPFINGAQLIDDSYNANPASMRAAAEVLAHAAGKRLLVLGDMGELGEASDALHAQLAADIRQKKFDAVLTLGPRMKRVIQQFGAHALAFDDVDPLAESLYPRLTQGATLLVKGSRSMATERVIQKLEQMSRGTR